MGADAVIVAGRRPTSALLRIARYDTRIQSHYPLLKTVEAAFGLSYIGHAADSTTKTLAPLLAPADR